MTGRCVATLTTRSWERVPGKAYDDRSRILSEYHVSVNFPVSLGMNTVAEAAQTVIDAAEPTGILGEHTHAVDISLEWEPDSMESEQVVKVYPYEDGDVTVLGPAIFATRHGDLISWEGRNYVPQDEQ
jgi:hypothetical protein